MHLLSEPFRIMVDIKVLKTVLQHVIMNKYSNYNCTSFYNHDKKGTKIHSCLNWITDTRFRGTQREKIGKRLRMQFSAFSYPFMAF